MEQEEPTYVSLVQHNSCEILYFDLLWCLCVAIIITIGNHAYNSVYIFFFLGGGTRGPGLNDLIAAVTFLTLVQIDIPLVNYGCSLLTSR